MPIFRRDEGGEFRPFEKTTPLPEPEQHLEDWIEKNAHVLVEGESLAIVGRQVGTDFGKAADLLAVDETGACVVIELKRGQAPREVIAQTLEYTAWVDSLSFDDLDDVAREYAAKRGLDGLGLEDLYGQTFSAEPDGEEGEDESTPSENRVTYNARQRMVIVAESFPGEMEQTLRYLRSKLGVDVSAVRFGIYRLEE